MAIDDLREKYRNCEYGGMVIAIILLPLVGTDDGTSIGAARKAREEIADLKAQIAADTKRFSDRCIELERIIESRVDRAVVDSLKKENAQLRAAMDGN